MKKDGGSDARDSDTQRDQGGSQLIDAGTAVTKQARAEVGPSGGAIVSPEGNLEVAVPPGALDAPVMVSVTLSEIAPPANVATYSPVFKFEPAGLTFKEPITVRFEVDGDEAIATVYWTKPDSDEFEAIGGDAHDGVIEVQVSHFSSGFCGANACKRNLKTDPDHCGACDHACPGQHGARACNEGVCSLTCDAGYADCDGDKSTGCEQQLSAANHCGSCGTQCAAGFACQAPSGSGFTCVDIDECSTDNGGCTGGRHCVNTQGGHTCECPTDTTWNGSACMGPPAPPTHYLISLRWSSMQEEVTVTRSDQHTPRVVGLLGDLKVWSGKTAISRDGSTLYAFGIGGPNEFESEAKMYVFDLSTGNLLRSIVTNNEPNHLARVLDAQGRLIAVNYSFENCSVVAIDPVDASVTLLSELGDRCTGDAFAPIVMSRDGNSLVLLGGEVTPSDPAEMREYQIHTFDLTQNALVHSAPDTTGGAYLAGRDAANRLIGLRWNGSAEEVVAIDASTGSTQVIGILGDLRFWQTDQSAIPPSGDRLYVRGFNESQDKVYVFDLAHDTFAGDFPDTIFALHGALDAPVSTQGQLYFTDPEHGGIYRANRDGSSAFRILDLNGWPADAISADTQYLYYSGYHSEGVWRANLDGTNPEQIYTSLAPFGGLHAAATHLYFTDPELGGGVYKANKDGSAAAQIIDLDGQNADAITADSQYVYYSGYNSTGVWRANLDGTNPEQLVPASAPSGVLHVTATNLYFTDPEHGGGVYKANKDGTGALKIVDFAGQNAEGLSADDRYIYYGASGAEGLWRADLDGTHPERIAQSTYPVRAICINP